MSNRLANSASPYLRQHAQNPVDWFPWGDEAQKTARSSQQLMVVSIGYAACHWCHVMERESFEDEEVAGLMNRHFVSVKIDRELRPDIDALYMQAVQIMSGRGGWPLNVVTLPDGRPIYGGTYFRKADWLQVLGQLQQLWQDDPEKVMQYATKLHEGLEEVNLIPVPRTSGLKATDLRDRFDSMQLHFDARWGGYGQAPKFPMPQLWAFCLHFGQLHQEPRALDQLHHSLQRMALGGIYDQLGGGFCRYAVDTFWHVPHFEKMLYDNAQLIQLYAQAYQQKADGLYAATIAQSITWAERELLLPNGLYACALDADSEGEEGKYYVWTAAELQALLTAEEWSLVAAHYGIGGQGHWEEGKHVLMVVESLEQIALAQQAEVAVLADLLVQAKAKLLAARMQRRAPALDNKALLGWNAMYLSGLVAAARALDSAAYATAAASLAAAMQQHFFRSGQWYRMWSAQEQIPAQAEDFSYLAMAQLDLYELNGGAACYEAAVAVEQILRERFYDTEQRLLSMTPLDEKGFVSRQYEKSDNVIPAASSVYARLLLRLHAHSGAARYRAQAEAMVLRILGETGSSGWLYYGGWGQAALLLHEGMEEVAILGPKAAQWAQALQQPYQPQRAWAWARDGDSSHPLLQNRHQAGITLLYLCVGQSCSVPVEALTEARALLKRS